MGRPHVDYKRQTLLFDPESYNGMVTIIGLGNIGSHAAMTLCRLGITSFVLYDHDKVEEHNLTSQFYDTNDLKKGKAVALAEKMKATNPACKILINPVKFSNEKLEGIVIIAVDTMKERKRICNVLKKNKSRINLLIDARIGGGQLEIYNMRTLKEWSKTFSDNPSHDPCGGRFICYTSVVTGALITNFVKRFLKEEQIDRSVIMHLDTLQILKNIQF